MIHRNRDPRLVTILKSADEIVNNSTTYQDDNELFLPVGVNQYWTFELYAIFTGNATADIKFTFTVPAGAVMFWGVQGYFDGNTDLRDQTQAVVGAANGATERGVLLQGIIDTAAAAGNMQLQWAQNVANASDTTVIKGSSLIAYRIL